MAQGAEFDGFGLCGAGRIFEFVHTREVLNETTLPRIVSTLLGAIRDLPHIAEKVCYALAQLAAGFKDDDATSVFSPYFKDIVGALLDAVSAVRPHKPSTFLVLNGSIRLRSLLRGTCATLPDG
jgi:importin subunit beta-1